MNRLLYQHVRTESGNDLHRTGFVIEYDIPRLVAAIDWILDRHETWASRWTEAIVRRLPERIYDRAWYGDDPWCAFYSTTWSQFVWRQQRNRTQTDVGWDGLTPAFRERLLAVFADL